MKRLFIYSVILFSLFSQTLAEDANLLKESCDNNNSESCLSLAMVYDMSENEDKNTSLILEYLSKGCNGGNAEGCVFLGYKYSVGKMVQQDYAKAKDLFTQACKISASECTALGKLYFHGRGVKEDKKIALEYYHKACIGGDEDTCFDLGNMYMDAKDGVEQNSSVAMDYYMKSCTAGKPLACSNVGALYERGNGVKQNYLQAKLYYSMACLDNDANACSNLGILYEQGKGVEQNFSHAKMYYSMACDKGNGDGCYNLAYMYHTGDNIPQDYEKAILAYEKSCNLYYDNACSNLGLMYATGQGVEKYFTKAKELWKKACDAGNIQGCSNYKKIIKKLRPINVELDSKAYAGHIASMIDDNVSIYDVGSEIFNGYVTLNKKKQQFDNYNDEILHIFPKDKWKIKSILTSMNILSKSMTLENVDTALENLETMTNIEVTDDKHYKKLLEFLPYVYLNHLEYLLRDIHDRNQTVALVTLYDTDGKEINSMKRSREYLISEAYKKMSEFSEETLVKKDLAVNYARISINICDLNPDALFHYAYILEDAEEEKVLLERVIRLIQKSDVLFDRDIYSLYNNLGYSLSDSGNEEYEDQALKYLAKAYSESDGKGLNSLGTMSNIYIAQKKYKEAYEIIEGPVYNFLHNSEEDIREKADAAYWYFVRVAIDTAYVLKDYNATAYMCEKYFLLEDKEYEDCHKYIKDIEQISPHPKPIHSFWKLYKEPETYNTLKKDGDVKGTLEVGAVMTYGDSLKYKSTSRVQSKLLEKFVALYAPYEVPHTLKELIKIEEKLGTDSYIVSFYLDPDDKEDFFYNTFSYEDKVLNKEVSKHFLPLAHVDGTGANAALWLVDRNETDLENAPIVEFGSEGQIDIIAKNLKDFIFMLSFGVEPMDGYYSQFLGMNEEYYRRENFDAYRKWLKETMKIDPVEDLTVWGTPKKIEVLAQEAQTLYADKLFQWLHTLIPNHGVVERKKFEADSFKKLSEEKNRLIHLIDKNATSKLYCLLAKNEQGLNDIERSFRVNVTDYYKQAFELENNITVIEEWAMFLSGFDNNSKIKSDKAKAHFYSKFSEIYRTLGNEVKAKEYQVLAITLYDKSVVQEKNPKKKMRLYESIAKMYDDANQTTNAIDYYKKAIAVKADDKLWLKKYFYVDLAELYEEEKEYLLAIDNYKHALSIVEKKRQKALYHYRIAENYKALGHVEQSLSYARKSLVQAAHNSVLKDKCLELIESIEIEDK